MRRIMSTFTIHIKHKMDLEVFFIFHAFVIKFHPKWKVNSKPYYLCIQT